MTPRPPRWLRLVARIVPSRRRDEWIREWHAEVARWRTDGSTGGRAPGGRSPAALFMHATEDALGMWRRSGGASAPLSDLRLAVRSLRRSPTFTLVAVLTLALGIGANTAIYSVVNNVLFRPLPYADAGTLVDVELSFRDEHTGRDRPIPASEPEFMELAEADVGLRLAGFWTSDVNLGGAEEPVRVAVANVSAELFDILGVQPAQGRTFRPGEDRPGNADVALLSHGLWVRAFGRDPSVVGGRVTLNGSPMTVVGVLPEGFVFPGGDVEVYRPVVIDPGDLAGRSSHYLSMVGRIDGDMATVQERIGNLAARWAEAFPGRHGITPSHPVTLISLRESMVGETRSALLLLLGVVLLVLLIASANVASLVLVRLEHRQSETGVRLALGAGVRGVVTPFLAESLLLVILGAGLGLAIASGALRAAELWGPDELTRLGSIRMDVSVLLFTGAISAMSAFVFGVLPALGASRTDALDRLRPGSRGTTGGRSRARLRQAMVVGEVTLAVVLVIGAGLLLKSFERLRAVDPGFEPRGVVTMSFVLSSTRYPEATDVAAFHDALAARLAAQPGVTRAGSIRALPFAGVPGVESMKPVDQPVEPDEYWNAQYQVVTPGFLEALGVPLRAGRPLEPSDRAGAVPVALVNVSMADAYWPGETPVGRVVKFGPPDGPMPELTIVGVVGDVRQAGPRAALVPQIFVPLAQAGDIYGGLGSRQATLAVHSSLPPAAALAGARQLIRELDPQLPVADMRSMADVMSGPVTDDAFLAGLTGAFSLLALILGAVGVGGLVAYTVERRTRELGLRLALGARRGGILRGVLTHAAGLTAAGIGLGIGTALVGVRVLESHLFDVSTTDPVVFVAAPLALLAAALAAAWIPAARATRIPPTEAMRAE